MKINCQVLRRMKVNVHVNSVVSSLFQDINKRLSLPADIRLPDDYLEKFNVIGPALFEQPISRRLRRVSLVCVTASFCFHAGVWDSFG